MATLQGSFGRCIPEISPYQFLQNVNNTWHYHTFHSSVHLTCLTTESRNSLQHKNIPFVWCWWWCWLLLPATPFTTDAAKYIGDVLSWSDHILKWQKQPIQTCLCCSIIFQLCFIAHISVVLLENLKSTVAFLFFSLFVFYP